MKKSKSPKELSVSEQSQEELEPIPERPPVPKEISKDDADKLQDYAQDLKDEITHVVDYGKVAED